MRWLKNDPVSSALSVAAFGWALLAVLLLVWPSAPTVRALGDEGQHLVVGLALSLVGGGAVAARTRWHAAVVGWVVLVATTVLLFLLELLQIPVPDRAFQWEDLAFGSFGAVLGGTMVTVGAELWRRRFVSTMAGFGGVTLVLACVAVFAADGGPSDNDGSELVAECIGAPLDETDWSLVVIEFGTRDGDCITTPIGPVASFGGSLDMQQVGLVFDGGGVTSAPLDGLTMAIVDSTELTFGVKFEVGEVGEVGPPTVLARLIIDEDPSWPLVQILQRGPHLASNVGSGRPTVGTGSVLADTLEPGATYEYVVTYADGEAVAYLDGEPLARSTVPPLRFELEEALSLEVGWRIDERWEPFIGRVDGLVLGATAITSDQVKNAFADS